MRVRVLFCFLVATCAERPGPSVGVYTNEDLAPELIERMEMGPITWRPLGFGALGWDEPIGDVVWVTVKDYPVRAELGGLGAAILERDLILLDFEAIRAHDPRPYYLQTLVAHELGHILLEAREHIPAGETGVMAAGGGTTVLEPADYEFACRVAGCCERW